MRCRLCIYSDIIIYIVIITLTVAEFASLGATSGFNIFFAGQLKSDLLFLIETEPVLKRSVIGAIVCGFLNMVVLVFVCWVHIFFLRIAIKLKNVGAKDSEWNTYDAFRYMISMAFSFIFDILLIIFLSLSIHQLKSNKIDSYTLQFKKALNNSDSPEVQSWISINQCENLTSPQCEENIDSFINSRFHRCFIFALTSLILILCRDLASIIGLPLIDHVEDVAYFENGFDETPKSPVTLNEQNQNQGRNENQTRNPNQELLLPQTKCNLLKPITKLSTFRKQIEYELYYSMALDFRRIPTLRKFVNVSYPLNPVSQAHGYPQELSKYFSHRFLLSLMDNVRAPISNPFVPPTSDISLQEVIIHDDVNALSEIARGENFDINKTVDGIEYFDSDERLITCLTRKDSITSLLGYSIYHHAHKCFKFLLLNGADVNYKKNWYFMRNSYSISLLDDAVCAGDMECFMELTEHNLEPTQNTVILAIQFHRNDFLEYLFRNC